MIGSGKSKIREKAEVKSIFLRVEHSTPDKKVPRAPQEMAEGKFHLSFF